MMKAKRMMAAIMAAAMLPVTSIIPYTANAVTQEKKNATIEEIVSDLNEGSIIIKDEFQSFGTRNTTVMDKDGSLTTYSEMNTVTILTDGKKELPVKKIDDQIRDVVNGSEYYTYFTDAGDGCYLIEADQSADLSGIYEAIKESCNVLKIEREYSVFATPDDTVKLSFVFMNSDKTDAELIEEYAGLGLSAIEKGDSGRDHAFKISKMSYNDVKKFVTNKEDGYFAFTTLTTDTDKLSAGKIILEKVSATGDANCDDKITVADAVAVLQYIANSEKYPMTEQARFNADIDGEEGITGGDATAIQRIDAGIWDES